ncbi:MAG TPA: molybdate ABC transporter substrate-binding protein [Burkholderiales bacterium]|nr:molybdate ABC transporter substrate-binding protein [Burkholderiales bacterium]
MKYLFRPLLVFAASLLFAAGSSMSYAANTFTVFAAASLKNALDDVVKAHEAKTGDKVVVSYAASPALARQIESGAPADIFISADTDWMDYVEKRSLIKPASRQNLLRNRLVLIAPADSTTTLKIAPGFALASALGKERLAMADPDSVPAGKYGKASLEALGVWKDVQSRVAAAENVRAALLLVARGETPFGIVYSTDAAVEPKVRVVGQFPENTHPPIIYPAALVATSKSAAAASFLTSLNQPAARLIFEKYGFK